MSLTPHTLLLIILSLVVFNFVLDQVLEYINVRAQREDIPDSIAAFYDREKYRKSQAYHREQTRFSFISSSFSVAIMIVMLVTGGFGWLDGLLRSVIDQEVWVALAFFGVLFIASDILSLPFQLYAIFVIEEKYGFNKTTLRTFMGDKVKSYGLGILVGGGLLFIFIKLVGTWGEDFWLGFWVVAVAFILITNVVYTSWIVPLFNKLTPLPEGELKDAISRYATSVGFPLDTIFVMDGSRRSKKANAFFSGIGRRKKIVLYDTLIANHTTDELVAVLAHEVGHYKKRHIIFSMILSVAQVGLLLWLMAQMILAENLSFALGGHVQAIHLNLLAFMILFSPVSAITGLIMNAYSRRNEYEADAYAAQTYNGAALTEALKKLSVDSLSNLYPHPAYVFVHYSHPPLLKRLDAIAHGSGV